MSISGRRMLDANFRRHLPDRKDAAILDIGCGFGDFLEYVQAEGYANLAGVELDAERADAARRRTGVAVEVITDLGQFLAARVRRYDLIVLKSVIAHLPRDKVVAYLHAMRDALSEDGRLVVETFNASRWTGPYLLYNDPTHLWAYTEYSLREVLEAAGFHVLEVTGEVVPGTGLRQGAWRALARAWTGVLRLIYFLERGRDRNPTILGKYLIAVCRHEPSRPRRSAV